MLASAVGGLLTRTLVSSQVECVTENASVYSFHMLMWLLCDFNAAKLFLGVNIFCCFNTCSCITVVRLIQRLHTLLYGLGSVPGIEIYVLYCT